MADRPHADVAAELGMSDGALRQLLLRARTTLRAAASALTPYPLVTWLAGGQEVSAARVAEVAAGAGGAGVAIKAGAAMLAAGAVVAGGPALRDEHAPARRRPAPSPLRPTARRSAARGGRHRAARLGGPPGRGRSVAPPKPGGARAEEGIERPRRLGPQRRRLGLERLGRRRRGLRRARQLGVR